MIAELYESSQLAYAAYAILGRGQTIDQLNQLTDEKFTETQARLFASRYTAVVTQIGDASGFSATIFADAAGNLTLAIRGTQFEANDLRTDSDIVTAGAGYDQIVAMANWWLRTSSPAGENVQQYRLISYAVDSVPVGAVTLRTDGVNAFVLDDALWTNATGEVAVALAGDAGHRLDVTGHSLGGHLAMAFLGLFGSATNKVTVFNAPGFRDSTINRAFFAKLGGSLPTNGPIINVAADEALTDNRPFNLIAGMLSRPGERIDIPIEDQVNGGEPSPNTARNHSIVTLADSLAVYKLLADLAPTLTASDYKTIFNQAAQDVFASYERTVDSLTALFKVNPGVLPAGNDHREDLYQAISYIRNPQNSAYDSRIGLLEIRPTPRAATDLLQGAASIANGLAYRYALGALSPFVVLGDSAFPLYAAHNVNGELDQYDPASHAGLLTPAWLEDRAAFLERKLYITALNLDKYYQSRNVSDSSTFPNAQGRAYQLQAKHFEDRTFGFIASTGGTSDSLRHFVFGSDGADAIAGADQDDHLYGGGGTDYLAGNRGDDYLEGGTGLDIYNYASADGKDTILDVDGKGLLRYSLNAQTTLVADASVKLSATQWASANNRVTYTREGNDLRVALTGDTGREITLKDWKEGDFGIRLWQPRISPQFSNDQVVLVGADDKGNSLTGTPGPDYIDGLGGDDSVKGDAGDDVIYGSSGNDLLAGDGGNDRIFGGLGDDGISGGAGGDELSGGDGKDFISDSGGANLMEGNAGSDIVFAWGAGRDELYADATTLLSAAILDGEQAGSGAKGDWLMAGPDADLEIGGIGDDVLMGGGGADIIVGGPGDDTIEGDLGWVAANFNWVVTRTATTQADGTTSYELSYSEAAELDVTPGGNDIIYAGSGEDWVRGGAAEDFIDAGTGDDKVFGEAGSDVLVGGAGNDVLVGDNPGNVTGADEGGDYLDGGAGDDVLEGDGGGDVLIGGAGNDMLSGGTGKDIYVFAKGDGKDVVFDPDDAVPGGPDASVLVLGDGVSRSDITFRVGSLAVDIGASDPDDPGSAHDVIHFAGFDPLNPTNMAPIGEIRFADGSSMSYAEILAQGFDIDGTPDDDDGHDAAHPQITGTGVVDRIRGFGGGDVLIGFAGDDLLNGGAGSDELYGGEGSDQLLGDGVDSPVDEQGADRLYGEAGNDVLQGDGGDDALYGGEGDDHLVGGLGNDFLAGELGNDRLFGGAGTDTLSGGQGNDLVSGEEGDDSLAGSDGDDDLFGGAGSDALHGGAGADQLFGNDGNDFLTGGKGDDVLFGGAGNDIYVLNLGDGGDYVDDNVGTNSLRFGAGITQASLRIARIGTSQSQGYVFITYGAGDTITIKDGANASTIQSYQFADGTVRTQAQILGQGQPVSPGTAFSLYGTPGPDFLSPTLEGDFRIYGGAGDDFVYGGSGNDRIDGGPDSDTLNGLGGSNTYVFGRASGHDTISNAFSGGDDKLEFESDVLAADVRITHEPNGDLRLSITSGLGEVTVQDFYGNSPSHLESIVYGDGALEDMQRLRELDIAPITAADDGSVTGTEFDDTLLGDARSNVLDGAGGNDLLQGGAGADIYIVKPGMRRDTLLDDDDGNVLKLAPGLDFRHLTPARQGDDLFLGILGTEDGALLKDYFLSNRPWWLENDGGDTKSLAQALAELADPAADESVERARDTWLAGIRNFAFSQLEPGYAGLSGNLLLQNDGEFQNYYTIAVRTSGSNAEQISNLYFWHDIGDLPDYGIAPVVRTTVNVNLGSGSLGLQPAGGGTGGFGNGFDNQFLVDYSRTDAEGNPLVIGTPDGSGHWSGSYVNLQTLKSQSSERSAANGASITVPVTVEQTNSISGLAAEFIVGGRANNLFTVFGFVAIDAGAGDDVLNATGWLFWDWGSPAGGDFLYGADGNDRIFGTDAPDVLIGGNGMDYLAGMGGHDTYKIFAGDTGKKIIDESVVHYSLANTYVSGWSNSGWFSTDVVEFSPGIDPDNLQFQWGQIDSTTVDDSGLGKRYGTLNLGWAPGKEVRIVLPDLRNPDVVQQMSEHPGASFGIERFKFADGTVLSMDDMLARATAQAGQPDPTQYGYEAGDGSLVLGDLNGLASVTFGHGIDPASLLVRGRAGDDVFLRLDASDSLRIKDWFATRSVDLHFRDGTVWDATELSSLPSLIVGTDGTDTLFAPEGSDNIVLGLRGDDSVFGASGSDTYVFSRGDGVDTIYDHAFGSDPQINTISFTPDIAPADVQITRDDAGGLYLVVGQDGGRILLTGWFDEDGSGKSFRARFADGTEWDSASLESRVARLPATPSSDVLLGSDGDDVVLALAGDDLVLGMSGDDVLDGGGGADHLEGGSGVDILRGGADDDVVHDADGHNLIDGGGGDDSLRADWSTTNFWIGGPGADNIEMNGGMNNIVAFNRGDGEDSVPVWFDSNQPLTLSLGGGIALADLSFVQEGADIVVDAGAGDRVHLFGWYFNYPHAETRLQLIGGGSIELFDLAAAVASWESNGDAASAALETNHLSTSTEQALGGSVAYEYATAGSLAAMSAPVMRAVLASEEFGIAPQPIAFERNSAPELVTPIADQATAEDSPFVFALPADTFAAADGVTYSASLSSGEVLPAWLHFDPATLTFSGTPAQIDVGMVDVRVTAMSGGGASADDTFAISVANVNDAPRAALAFGERAATQDQPFAFALPAGAFTDEDPGDQLTVSAAGLPAWLTFDPLTRSFGGIPRNGDVGTATVQVTATDAAGLSASSAFGVAVANVNDAPAPADDLAAVSEDGVVSASGNVLSNDSDIDADTRLTVLAPRTMQGRYGTLQLSADGAFTYSSSNGAQAVQSLHGREIAFDDFSYAASDGLASTSATLRVSIVGRNDAPVAAPDVAALFEDAKLSAMGNVLANDSDADADSTLTVLNAGTYLDPATGLGTFTLRSDGSFAYALNNSAAQALGKGEVVHERFSYLASDGYPPSADEMPSDRATGTIDVSIHGENDAPWVSAFIPDFAATEDQRFVYTLPTGAFADVDHEDRLAYAASRSDGGRLPDWLAFDGQTLTFSGTPANGDVGMTGLSVTATDTWGASASQSFVLAVANVNDAPVLASSITDQFVEAGASLNFTVPQSTFRDVDAGDVLALSARAIGGGALPSWLQFNPATATFSGTPQTANIGVSGVEVRASDKSGASAAADFALVVTAKAGSNVSGSAGADVIFGGNGNETLSAGGGDDALFGRGGNDVLRAGRGNDVLQGGEGADVLHGGKGNNLLDGGTGNDAIFDGAGSAFIAGGAGADTIHVGGGRDVLAYNRGDGSDTVIGGGDGGNTLSLGGGIRYSDLSLSKAGRDLIVNAGGDDRIVFKDWYGGNKSLLTLQMIADASADFDATSGDPLRNRRVESFNFLGLVTAFDQARVQSPGLTSWALTNALLRFHLAGSDEAARGGDLAYWYGKNGSLAGMSLQAAQQAIGAAGFGADAQQLHAFSGLQDGLVKLGL